MDHVDAMNPPNDTSENWHVQLPNGELRVMTLDQLDQAFEEGLINEDTHVLQVGGTVWAKLGEIAGLEGGEAPVEAAPATVASATLETAAPPLDEPHASHASPVTHAPAVALAASPVPAYVEAASVASPAFAPSAVMAPSAVVPYAAVAAAPVAPVVRYDMPSSLPSLRPVVSEVDLDDMPVQFRSKKRGFVVAAVAVTLLGGVAVAAVTLGGSLSAPSAAAPPSVTANVAAAVAAPPPPAVTSIPELAANALPPAKETRLNDEQRRVLLEADKSRAAKQKARAVTPRHASHKSGGTPFHAGGSPGDPLNSSL